MDKLIDIDHVFKKHAPKTYKALPRFIIKFIKKIIHQDEINAFIEHAAGKKGYDFVKELIYYFDIKVKISGIENIDKNDKKLVFASNHPLGGFDGVCLIGVIHHFFGNVKAIVNDLLLNIDGLKPVFTGVNVFGKLNKNQIKEVDQLYSSDTNILVFPAGEVSRKKKGVVSDSSWQKSFLTKAIEYKRNIIPVFTDALNSKLFYFVSSFRRFWGIKANLELFLLPKELFRFRGKTITFYFGQPISVSNFNNKAFLNEYIKQIREKLYSLKQNSSNILDFRQIIENYSSEDNFENAI